MKMRTLAILLATTINLAGGLVLVATPSAQAATSTLYVGVGQTDITPVTGGYRGGWACSCAKVEGQHTRLYAHVIVLRQGSTKVALVTEDLGFLSAGMIRDAAALLPGRGFSEKNIVDSATHTHSGPAGYMNFSSYNSVFPSIVDPLNFSMLTSTADQIMYNFLTRQLAKAIAQADNSLAPGAVGWGHTTLYGITQNRSLEAHLADYGINEAPGTGTVGQDPHGYDGTIDPAVDVLRVDRYVNGSLVPAGLYTTFANHGTVDKPDFWYFSGDHQASAERVLGGLVRQGAHLSPTASFVTAFANSDAGDMSSGLKYSGPADAEYVGRREASAMYTAWIGAGSHMSAHPSLAVGWTRHCMCGQSINGHPTDSSAEVGNGQGAGSEEGRTILGDLGIAKEGAHLPTEVGPQGDKMPLIPHAPGLPQAVPLTVVRIGDEMLVTWPGEPTIGVGRALRSQVMAAVAGTGIQRVVIAGYAGEYLDYWTTPQEYEAQHYEGGSTVYGEYASDLVESWVAQLANRVVLGKAPAIAYSYDPNQGLHITAAAYGAGAGTAAATAQPAAAAHLGHPAFAWNGGAYGIDRPVDRSFVKIQKLTAHHWNAVADDLGLQIMWSVDSTGHYLARWEVPLTAPSGTYRFVVSAKRYQLISRAFRVSPGAILVPTVDGGAIALRYPHSTTNADWTYRPSAATGGTVTFIVDGRQVVVASSGSRFAIPKGRHVSIPVGGVHDRYGNTNRAALTIR